MRAVTCRKYQYAALSGRHLPRFGLQSTRITTEHSKLSRQSDSVANPTPQMRTPMQVMRLARLGAFHQSRLSFMRVLLRRLHRENWQISRNRWEVDANGVGVAVYTAQGPERIYSLIAFANDLDPAKRSDRVIAEEWDATFTLFDGIPSQHDIDRLAANVPLQEAGRVSGSELSLSRANRSVRLFNYVREKLAAGEQPDIAELDQVGYLMRTTAVYGSGKFGACDRRFLAAREEFAAPFQTELLGVYMIRAFSTDIVEHLAAADNPQQAVTLAPDIKRRLGIGNSTGLGMAPFIVNHPTLLNNWILARETALHRVRQQPSAGVAEVDCFKTHLARQIQCVDEWHTSHELQQQKIVVLREDLARLGAYVETLDWQSNPWNTLYSWAEQSLSLEGQECLVSLIMEPYPQLVDELSSGMSIDEQQHFKINGRMALTELRSLIDNNYRFVTDFNAGDKQANARFWYASEEKLEPRLGERFEEDGAEREHPLATARDVAALLEDIDAAAQTTVAAFLLEHPQHRHSVRRVQQSAAHPYSEVADNLIAAEMLPIDLLRCKLSFFGAVKFDPRSDRWVRITMYQHAPNIDEVSDSSFSDSWIYPPLEAAN